MKKEVNMGLVTFAKKHLALVTTPPMLLSSSITLGHAMRVLGNAPDASPDKFLLHGVATASLAAVTLVYSAARVRDHSYRNNKPNSWLDSIRESWIYPFIGAAVPYYAMMGIAALCLRNFEPSKPAQDNLLNGVALFLAAGGGILHHLILNQDVPLLAPKTTLDK